MHRAWSARSGTRTPAAVLLRLDVAGPGRPPARPALRGPADAPRTATPRRGPTRSPPRPPTRWWSSASSGSTTARSRRYLADVVEPGDELELRGPIGGWFVWDGRRPAVGVAGGTGVVPAGGDAAARPATWAAPDLLRCAVSARTAGRRCRTPRSSPAGAAMALTREATGGRPAGRLDRRRPRGRCWARTRSDLRLRLGGVRRDRQPAAASTSAAGRPTSGWSGSGRPDLTRSTVGRTVSPGRTASR